MDKITFRKGKKERGKAGIGSPTPMTEIFLNGKEIGCIKFNDGRFDNEELGIRICLKIIKDPSLVTKDSPCLWETKTYGKKNSLIASEEEARAFAKDHLIPKYRDKIWIG